jgi:hypothetical protein
MKLCPLCGFAIGPLDSECMRCRGKGIAPVPPPIAVPAIQTGAPSSSSDLFGAVIAVVMILACWAMMYHLISATWTHEDLVMTNRFGRNGFSYQPFSITWWFALTMGAAASSYCIYLLAQLVRKQS